MLLLAHVKQQPSHGVSCQLHKRGMNFHFLLRNSVKRYLALLQMQIVVCSDQIIALMILACRDNYNYMAQYIAVAAITSTRSMGAKKGKAQSSRTALGKDAALCGCALPFPCCVWGFLSPLHADALCLHCRKPAWI